MTHTSTLMVWSIHGCCPPADLAAAIACDMPPQTGNAPAGPCFPSMLMVLLQCFDMYRRSTQAYPHIPTPRHSLPNGVSLAHAALPPPLPVCEDQAAYTIAVLGLLPVGQGIPPRCGLGHQPPTRSLSASADTAASNSSNSPLSSTSGSPTHKPCAPTASANTAATASGAAAGGWFQTLLPGGAVPGSPT